MKDVQTQTGPLPAALLEALYASVLDPGQLQHVNVLLAQATGASMVAVLGHDVANGRGRLSIAHGIDTATLERVLAEHDLRDDPWITRVVPQLAKGVVINSDDLLPRQQMQRTDAFNRHYRRLDVGQQVASVGHFDGSNSVTLSICRAVGAAAFTASELEVLRALTPHWVNAYAIQRKMSWLQQQVESLEAATALLPTAMMVLDAQQRVLTVNPAGEQLIAAGDIVMLQQRSLVACQRPKALRELLVLACRGATTGRHAGALTLYGRDGRAVLIARVHPLPSRLEMSGGGAAILFIQPVGGSVQRNLNGLLRTLYPLTAAEAAIAEALYHHPDLAEAARQVGVSTATAQTRLKVVYDKTGEHGQPALMRLLAAVASTADLPSA